MIRIRFKVQTAIAGCGDERVCFELELADESRYRAFGLSTTGEQQTDLMKSFNDPIRIEWFLLIAGM